MAFITQEEKKSIAENINPILKEYGIKGSLSIRNNSELVLTLFSGPIDFVGNYNETASERYWDRFEPITEAYFTVNEYHYENEFSGIALEFLKKVFPFMQGDNWYCNDDVQSDYFSRKHYYTIKVGKYNRPYIFKPNNSQFVPVNSTEEIEMSENTETVTNKYSTATISEIIESLNEMSGVVDRVMELSTHYDVSTVQDQLTEMVNEIAREIHSRMVAA